MLVNGITISDEWIDRQCELLDISIEEAVDMYLADVGAVENEAQNELDNKAKKVKINHGATDKMNLITKLKRSKSTTVLLNPKSVKRWNASVSQMKQREQL